MGFCVHIFTCISVLLHKRSQGNQIFCLVMNALCTCINVILTYINPYDLSICTFNVKQRHFWWIYAALNDVYRCSFMGIMIQVGFGLNNCICACVTSIVYIHLISNILLPPIPLPIPPLPFSLLIGQILFCILCQSICLDVQYKGRYKYIYISIISSIIYIYKMLEIIDKVMVLNWFHSYIGQPESVDASP